MNTKDFWNEYVGDESPADFMLRHQCADPCVAARAYVMSLPHLFGIVLRGAWDTALRQEFQLGREEAIAGLVDCLESTRAEWYEAVAGYDVPEESRFAMLAADKVEDFLGEEITFRGVEPAPTQNVEIDQNRAFKEMPFPKSYWFEESVKAKVLVNVPTDQEIETRMLEKRSGVSNEVIEKYAAMVGDDDEE